MSPKLPRALRDEPSSVCVSGGSARRVGHSSSLTVTHHARKPRTTVAPAHSREQKQCIRVEEMLRVEHRRIYIGSAPCETCSGERPSERKEDSQPSVS